MAGLACTTAQRPSLRTLSWALPMLHGRERSAGTWHSRYSAVSTGNWRRRKEKNDIAVFYDLTSIASDFMHPDPTHTHTHTHTHAYSVVHRIHTTLNRWRWKMLNDHTYTSRPIHKHTHIHVQYTSLFEVLVYS